MIKQISLGEKTYIEQGCRMGMRQDGRDLGDCRTIFIENDILPQANGSSRVKIGDSVDILCSVKVEASDTHPLRPNEGFIEIATEFSPSCNLKVDDRKISDISAQISQVLESCISQSSCIDFTKLCIIPSKYCWAIYVDILILQLDGEPIDACSIGLYTALKSTYIPKFETVIGESGVEEEFDISGDIADSIPLPIKSLPICITTFKIGSNLVLDCNSNETFCASAGLIYAIDRNLHCYGVTKIFGGSFTLDEIEKSLELAKLACKSKISVIDSFFSSENPKLANDSLFPEVPHIRIGYLA